MENQITKEELQKGLEALQEESTKAIEAAKNAAVKESKDAVAEATKALDDVKAEKDELIRRVGELEKRTKSNSEAPQSLVHMVDKWLSDNIETIKKNYKANNGIISLDGIEKAVGNMTSANITLPTALPAGYVTEQQGASNVRLRRPSILDHVNTFSTDSKTLTYVEAEPGEGGFAVVLEGGLKPQLDLDFVERFVQPTKFAGWIKVTDELIEDFPRMRDVIVNYLREKHDLFKEAQVYAYINTNATSYATGGSLAGSVTMPNIMDVVAAMQSQILNTPNYTDEPPFMGDTVLMNHADFFKYFGFAKDALGRPLYDNGYQSGMVFRLNGFSFVATPLVTAGNIVVYDSTKINVTNYIPYHVEIGWVNDDFIRNQFVILGESRGHIYATEHDKRAFVKASIAAVIADIAVPEPDPE